MSAKIPDRQAVVIIHGMGEQQAMDTLRSFVDVVWSGDESQRPYRGGPQVWSKPDYVSDALELRRLTTNANTDEVCTDFFEFYWAHLLSGSKLSHVLSWVNLLLFRKRKDVPDPLFPAWIALWVLSALIGLLVIDLTLDEGSKFLGLSAFWTAIIGFILAVLNAKVIAPIIGDAARYLSAAPVNVKQRRAIRDEGATLLRKLIESGKYRRIVVVGHSLGSIIGYDILRDVWAEYNTRMDGQGPSEALDRLQALANTGPLDREAYRDAQRDYVDELRANGNPWCVTDFVTMGSPLAHANALMARDFDEFGMKVEQREFPTCPPINETINGAVRFTYDRTVGPIDNRVSTAVPHHGAVFAPVRWTNLYFPCRNIVEGDLIGGPVAPVLGEAIEDIAVRTSGQGGYFTHTHYWTVEPGGDRSNPGSHIMALRQALRLVEDRPENAGGVAAVEPERDEALPEKATAAKAAVVKTSATKSSAAKTPTVKKTPVRRTRAQAAGGVKKTATPRKRRSPKPPNQT